MASLVDLLDRGGGEHHGAGTLAANPGEPEQAGEEAHGAEAEEDQIRRVLTATGGNKSKAAQILGIERKTLYRKLDRMKL